MKRTLAAGVVALVLATGGSMAFASSTPPPPGPGPRQPTALGGGDCWKWKLDTVWESRNITPAPPGYYPTESRQITNVLLWCPTSGYTIKKVWGPWRTPQPDGTLG